MIIQYEPGNSAHDHVLLQWHREVMASDEASKTFVQGMESPSVFLSYFQPPRQFVAEVDEFSTVQYSAWLDPCMSGTYLSFWARPERRKSKAMVQFYLEVIEAVFQHEAIHVILGTIQDRPSDTETTDFLKLHESFGYEYVGAIPYLFDGKDAHIVALTRDGFAEAGARKLSRLRKHTKE